MKLRSLMMISLLTLGACTSPAYGPASSAASFGYTEQKIENGRFRVTYRGQSIDDATDGALRRAAELTLAAGYDYFTTISLDTERLDNRGSGSRVGIGTGSGSRSGTSVGVGISLPLGGSNEKVAARIEVIMGFGEKPDEPNAYDARAVLSNLGD